MSEIGKLKIAAAELEALEPTIKMLRWYLGARSVNSEEAARASRAAIKEFEIFEETWSPLAKARRGYKLPG